MRIWLTCNISSQSRAASFFISDVLRENLRMVSRPKVGTCLYLVNGCGKFVHSMKQGKIAHRRFSSLSLFPLTDDRMRRRWIKIDGQTPESNSCIISGTNVRYISKPCVDNRNENVFYGYIWANHANPLLLKDGDLPLLVRKTLVAAGPRQLCSSREGPFRESFWRIFQPCLDGWHHLYAIFFFWTSLLVAQPCEREIVVLNIAGTGNCLSSGYNQQLSCVERILRNNQMAKMNLETHFSG